MQLGAKRTDQDRSRPKISKPDETRLAWRPLLSAADGLPAIGRGGPPPPVDAPADQNAQATGGVTDRFQKIAASLRNQNRSDPAHIGGHLAQFVNATSWTVQVREARRNAPDSALVTVYGVVNSPFDQLPQIVVPFEIACSNSDFHISLLSFSVVCKEADGADCQ